MGSALRTETATCAEAPDLSRDIRAAPAAPGESALRTAYLDLLKLSLSDLAGAGTTTVSGLPHSRLASSELGTTEELQARANGRDWPLHALTMTGLVRLDDLEQCVETIVHDSVARDLIKAGSWRGGSSVLMRATLDSLGAEDELERAQAIEHQLREVTESARWRLTRPLRELSERLKGAHG